MLRAMMIVLCLWSAPSVAPAMDQRPTEDERIRIEVLVRDLVNDRSVGNATRAMKELSHLRAKAVPALEAALRSKNEQQRHFAAYVLRGFAPVRPSGKLLEVTVEGLRDDDIPEYSRKRPFVFNATDGVDFLLRHVDAAKTPLLEALDSKDGQQRYLAAYVIAMRQRSWQAVKVSGILIEHLEDNSIKNDASLSCSALARLGAAALPHLRQAAQSSDSQQGALVAMLIRDIEDPARARHPEEAVQQNVIYDPQLTERILNIPTIRKRARWQALERVADGTTPVPSLARLRAEYPGGLMVREISHTSEYSVLQFGTGPFPTNNPRRELDEQNIWKVLLVIRVHYAGSVYRRSSNSAGEVEWIPERE